MEKKLEYEAIKAYCQSREKLGERVSLRQLVEKFGGSLSTAAKLKRQYEEEQRLAVIAGQQQLSETLQLAMMREIAAAVERSGAECEQAIDRSHQREIALEEQIAALEAALAEQTELAVERQRQIGQLQAQIERNAALEEQRSANHADQVAELRHRLNVWQERHNATSERLTAEQVRNAALQAKLEIAQQAAQQAT
ncbi:MAG: hypothetical protein M0O99_03135 [Desulfuromonas thiophila]|jgi:hypothetical protein|nr:hypothetical protein [Desulfuromonas thiophila]